MGVLCDYSQPTQKVALSRVCARVLAARWQVPSVRLRLRPLHRSVLPLAPHPPLPMAVSVAALNAFASPALPCYHSLRIYDAPCRCHSACLSSYPSFPLPPLSIECYLVAVNQPSASKYARAHPIALCRTLLPPPLSRHSARMATLDDWVCSLIGRWFKSDGQVQ